MPRFLSWAALAVVWPATGEKITFEEPMANSMTMKVFGSTNVVGSAQIPATVAVSAQFDRTPEKADRKGTQVL